MPRSKTAPPVSHIVAADGRRFVAFAGFTRIAGGDLHETARGVKTASDRGPDTTEAILVFDATTSEPLELDLRGSLDDVLARLGPASSAASASIDREGSDAADQPPRGPGRPRLGVVPRELTLLPRHWEWLAEQPGGASAAVRRLVDEARATHSARDQRRRAQESAYRFMSSLLGNQDDFEEATRALFAGDAVRFDALVRPWPSDARDHLRTLAERVFNPTD